MNRFAAFFLLALTHAANAALDTEPYVYDPMFNSGIVVEDRFAATTLETYLLGLKIAVAENGDVIAAGLVPRQYAALQSGNLGLVRYSANGARVAWSSPTPAYTFFNNYVDYPNSDNGNIRWVTDLKIVNGRIYVLVNTGASAISNHDVHVLVFSDGGAFIEDRPAFETGLDENGAALLPYCYFLYNNGIPVRFCMLVATATYTNGSGRQVVTMKRFRIAGSDGSLGVDTSFGVSGNGAMDQAAPNSLCDAGINCSWNVRAATAVRTNTASPTFYLAGTIFVSGVKTDAFVMAINGQDGSLFHEFGQGNSGIYDANLDPASSGVDVLASTSGDASTDIIHLASNVPESCGQKGAVTKIRARVMLPGGPVTLPDFAWGNGGTRDIGGNPGSCGNVYTYLTSIALDADRLAIAGWENIVSTIPDPLLAVVRVADGALTVFARAGFPPRRADGSLWGGASFNSIASVGGGRFATTGYLYDASANNALLFGTARFSSDRIFGDAFE